MNPVYQCLRQLRRRLWLQSWIRRMGFAAIVIGAAEIGLAVWRLIEGREPFTAIHLLVGLMVIPIAAAGLTLRQSWSWRTMAKRADELGESRDRFQSYLEFSEQTSPNAVRDLALKETEAYAVNSQIRPTWQTPRALWELVPLVLMGMALPLIFSNWSKVSREPRLAAEELVRAAAPEIAKLAQKWQEPKLEQAAELLRAQAAELNEKLAPDPRRAALEAIAKSEESVRSAAGNFSELQKTAQALADASESKELRDAIAQEDYSRAAEIAKKSPAEGMQRAITKATEAGNLPSLAKLKESPNPGEDAAQMLRQTAQAAFRNKDMQRLLSALQDLKLQPGKGDSSKPTETTEASGSDKAAASSSSESGEKASDELTKSEASGPEGQGKNSGGGEGEAINPDDGGSSPTAEGPKEMLSSVIGQGDSLQEIVLSTADDSEAKRRYQAIYDAAQADETATVERETLPNGSRGLVKRYLESIRP